MVHLRCLSKALATFTVIALAFPIHTWSLPFMHDVQPRADTNLVGYLGTFFLGDKPNVYFYLSNGNNPNAFTALNKGSPVIVPTKGTRGVRDPAIIAGGGSEAGKKWYIIGTDLDIGKTTWDASQRTGSLSIFVWESTDLINWKNERVVKVEDNVAGMVWAPEAIWDEDKGQYLVYWASRFYPTSDAKHTGKSSNAQIRCAYTSDFSTFSKATNFVDYSPTDVIDLTILPLDNTGKNYVRFIKNESAKNVFSEITSTGLLGTWTRIGGSSATISSGVEGPAAYWDNQVANKAHLLLDFYGSDGYHPYESVDVKSGKWTESSRSSFPKNLRHGSVLPITQVQYDALKTKWG